MKRIKKYSVAIAILFLSFGMHSCYEDLGNYDYQEINEFSISGIEESYECMIGEYLTIRPELTFTNEPDFKEENYSFEWRLLPGNPDMDPVIILDTTYILDNYHVLFLPGEFSVFYRVKDKRTGFMTQKEFSLKTVMSIYEGFLVLNDVNGVARLDMLSYRNKKFHYMKDVLSIVESGVPPLKNPTQIVACVRNSDYGIFLLTESKSYQLEQNTFKVDELSDFENQVLDDLPANSKYKKMIPFQSSQRMSNSQMLFINDDVYINNLMMRVPWGMKCNTLDGYTHFKVAPFGASSINGTVVFNDETKGFYFQGTGKCIPMETLGREYFKFNNMNSDLVYLQDISASAYPSGLINAVMKSKSDNKYRLARFSFLGNQYDFNEILAEDFDQAKHYAISPQFVTQFFYAVGGKLYKYDLAEKTTRLMQDFGSEEITMLRFDSSVLPKYKFYIDLWVATHNPATGKGSMRLYQIKSISAPLEIRELDGVKYEFNEDFGRIVSAAYRAR